MSPRISASGSASVRGGVDVPHARTVTRRIPPILRADACQRDVRLSGYPNRYTMMKSALNELRRDDVYPGGDDHSVLVMREQMEALRLQYEAAARATEHVKFTALNDSVAGQ